MRTKHPRFSLLLLIGITISFLSACGPPVYRFIVVEKISVSKNVIYVRASHSQECSNCETIEGFIYYASHDKGQTWEEVTSPTNEVLQILEQKQNKQSPVCILVETEVCYRITDKEQVEISNDGGATWQSDWQIPAGRKYYMQRHAGPSPTFIPFDIQVTESTIGYFVVVAMGNQGVLVKSLDGNWNRYAVGAAVPTPYQASNFRETWGILNSEYYPSIFIAILCFFLISVCGWITIFIKSETDLKNKILKYWSLTTLFLIALVFLCLVFRVLTLIFLFLCLAFMITWFLFIIFVPRSSFSILVLLLGMVFSVTLFFCFLFPYQLWVLGTISVYETALVISSLVGIIVVLIALITEFRIAVLAVKPINKLSINNV